MYFTSITDSIHKYGTRSPHRIYRPKLSGNEGGGGVAEICRIFFRNKIYNSYKFEFCALRRLYLESKTHHNSGKIRTDVGGIWSPKPIIVAGKFALMLAVTFDVNRVVSLGILMYINGRKFPDKV